MIIVTRFYMIGSENQLADINKNQDIILIKTSQGEMDLSYYCNKQYKIINNLLFEIEKEFNTSMDNHQELRHKILDISNFIKRLPNQVSEIVVQKLINSNGDKNEAEE